VPLRWRGLTRRPIPPEWQRIGLRQSATSGTNRNTTHPLNALLNYAYGVLESQVRIAVLAAGLDPSVGYLHASHPGRAPLVYDLMEPFRPLVDRLVLQFLSSHTFSPCDVTVVASGACRLHPQLARRAIGLAVRDHVVRAAVVSVAESLRTRTL
jgi:CRISPR-associated endonuclease Cas1